MKNIFTASIENADVWLWKKIKLINLYDTTRIKMHSLVQRFIMQLAACPSLLLTSIEKMIYQIIIVSTINSAFPFYLSEAALTQSVVYKALQKQR